MQNRILSGLLGALVLTQLEGARVPTFRGLPAIPNPYAGPVLKPVQPAQANKRARKAAGVVGRKASKRFYRQFKRGAVHAE